jgi:hypothetical protein
MKTGIKALRQGELLVRTGACDRTSVGLNVDFSTGMHVAEQTVRESRDYIVFVVHPRKVGDLGVEERSPVLVANAWRPKCDTFDHRALR